MVLEEDQFGLAATGIMQQGGQFLIWSNQTQPGKSRFGIDPFSIYGQAPVNISHLVNKLIVFGLSPYFLFNAPTWTKELQPQQLIVLLYYDSSTQLKLDLLFKARFNLDPTVVAIFF